MVDQDQTRPDVFHNRVYNDDIIKGRWKEVKGGVRKLWGELSDNELEETKGEMTSIAGLIQRKYGESKVSIEQKLDNIFREFYDEEAELEADRGESDDDQVYDQERQRDEAFDAAYRNPRERQL
jgi:uncharacterized protein YjbJ (UPF0337 family)